MSDLHNFADRITAPVRLETILPGLQDEWQSAVLNSEKQKIKNDVRDYLKIVAFAGGIGVPFCVESNPAYRSPHAVIHEIGHWAVKPNPYIYVYRRLSQRDFLVLQSDVIVDEPFAEAETLRDVTYYPGNNDRMPDWDLPDDLDPTPNEKSVRAWTRHVISKIGLQDPITMSRKKAYDTHGVGDKFIAKGSSYRTWSAVSTQNQAALHEFEIFGIDPVAGIFRPYDDTLRLPYINPATLEELEQDVREMHSQYPARIKMSPDLYEDWLEQVRWKYRDIIPSIV